MGNGAGRRHSISHQERRGGSPELVRSASCSSPSSVSGFGAQVHPAPPGAGPAKAETCCAAEGGGSTSSSAAGPSCRPAHEAALPGERVDGLAARRAAQGRLANLSVKVDKVNPRRVVLGQLSKAQDNSSAQSRGIQRTDAFDKLYAIGAQVMPSVHPGMEVRHAMNLQDCSRVVIKVRQKANSFASAQEEREWRQSAEFMLNLPKSGSIAEIYAVWEDKDAYYVVMERVGGSDLFELLDAEGLLPASETKAILKQVLMGVAALHREGCIHKDLKLENVMVDRSTAANVGAQQPIVKLIDFDTAQSWEPNSPKAKTVLGTDQYISQEAYAGNYSPASDIFAVGVIAYKLLTGFFPFNGKVFDDEAGENWVGSPKMKQIQERVQRASINWSVPPFGSDPVAADLVRAMLAPRDGERPKAEEALRHPFFGERGSPTLRRKG